MAPPSQCNLKLRMVFATIGVLIGVSVFFSFGLVFKNWDTACFGLASGIAALATLLCHIQYRHDEWKRAADLLSPLMLSGCFVQLLGVVAFAVYLALAINQHQKLTPNGPQGYYLACVWCLMTWKWGFALFYFARQYRNLYRESTGFASDHGYGPIP